MRPIRPMLLTLFLLALLAWSLPQATHGPGPAQAGAARPSAALTPFVDTHAHPQEADVAASFRAAVAEMKAENASEIFFMPKPYTFESTRRTDYEAIAAEARKHPGRFRFLGGGGSLNPMIQEAVRTGDAGPEVQKRFREKAEEIVRAGAVGFGEMSGEHTPDDRGYQHAPPDHPLYLLLADIAAQHNMPIDIHLEAVTHDMPLPPAWSTVSPRPDPPVLHENIRALERLLAHNPKAKIIWSHGGWDNTGDRTPALMRRLFRDHPNLYSNLKCAPDKPGMNTVLANGTSGPIKPEWLQLFKDYPDRFMMGCDQPYPPTTAEQQRWHCAVDILNQLPADLRQKIAVENVKQIYPPMK